VEVLVAPAGTGKTHTLAAFARAWTAWTGRRVIGLAMSTNAARVMAAEGLAEGYNMAQFLGKLPGTDRTRGALQVSRDDVLVIDEASQVSTGDLAKIQAVASAAGARVILVGDTAQLGAVEAGGMMRLLAETLGHWELAEVRRFDAEWERDASLGLRRGERAAWAQHDAHGRARGGPQDQARAGAVALWLADYLLGRDTLLLAGSNDEAAELARQARERLVKLGQVAARPVVHLSDGNGAAVGDVVRARLNTKIPAEAGAALINRDTLRLAGFGGQAPHRYALAERKTPEGWTRPFPVPVSYLENHAELAYAGNVAVSQGRTVDVAHLLVSPTLSRESFYVGMTRGRVANTAHVVTGPPQPRTGDPLPQAEVEAVVADILATESASLTATEVMRQGQDAPVNSRHVFAMWSATTRAAAYAAIDAGLRDRLIPADYQRYLDEPQRPVFQRQVREAELAGRDLAAVLDVAAGQAMTGARSVAAVMHGRLKAAQITGAGQTVTWAERTPAALRAGLGGRLADHLDARAAELGRAQAARPEPWLVRHLGPPPGPEASAALRADYEHRAAVAASYREAAGITDPHVSLGELPRGVPELAEGWRAAARALEIPDETAAVRAMTRAELEAWQTEGERVNRAAPVEVSRELRAAELRAADETALAAEMEARGLTQEAADRRFAAEAAAGH
jgi:AAA domain